MALSPEQLQEFRTRVLEAKRPLFFYDDDGDGLCSYLLCLRARSGDSQGYRVHASAAVTADLVRKVDEVQPDLIVILDKPYLEQAFVDAVSCPIIWLDHHEPQSLAGFGGRVTYFNPRVADDADNRCTTHWAWHALGREEDLWLAAIGVIGDWQLTDVAQAFSAAHPDLLGPVATAPQAMYEQPFGVLTRLVQFNLKGDSSDVRTAIKILARVETHTELLLHKTPRAKLLWKRYEKINREYERLLVEVRTSASDKPILLHVFGELAISLISELSNQLIHEYPDKIIFLARSHNGEHKLSIRSASVPVAPAVKTALVTSGARGNAGGHTLACGGKILDEDFPKFYEAFVAALAVPRP
jgi:single-stranded DNA-specific DHH superfamily exonuclease